jgi:hypothetical protein
LTVSEREAERYLGLNRLKGAQRPKLAGHRGSRGRNIGECDMISEIQIHTIARQMFEKHGLRAIAQAAQNALECENQGNADEANEWRHIEDAMKSMRGPHQS